MTVENQTKDRPYSAGQVMGLVLALRLVCGGAVLFLLGLVGLLLTWSENPSEAVSLGLLFSFYLFAVGNVLLVFRVHSHLQRLLLLSPLSALVPLAQESVRSSLGWVCLILSVSAFLYLEGLLREAGRLENSKVPSLMRRLQGLIPVCLGLVFFAPQAALAVMLALVPGFFYACWLWLQEMRAQINALDEA